jgi:two-component sensor histidine kinase
MNRIILILFSLFVCVGSAQTNKEIDSLLRISKTEQSDSTKAVLYQAISKKYAPTSFDTAYLYAKKALTLAEKSGNDNLIIESYKKIGLAYDYQYKIDSTLFWYHKALAIAQENENIPQLIKLYNHIGIAHYYKTAYDESLNNLHKALKYSEQINDSSGIARSYNNIGYIHEKQNNYTEALNYYLKSLKIKELIDSERSIIPSLMNLSNISFRNDDFEGGKNYLLRALAISKKVKDTSFIALNYSYLAISYANNNQLDKSNYYLQKSLSLRDKVNDKYRYGQLLYDLGGTYAKIGAFKEAEKAYLESVEINKTVHPEFLEPSYKELSDLYRTHKKYVQALNYYDKYSKLKDSIYTLKKEKAISTIEAKYDTEKKEKQINLLKSNVKQQEMKKRFWFWISGLSFLLALLFVFFVYSYKKRSDELVTKNQLINKTLTEKETLLKEIHHRVKNNLQVISSILALQIHYLKNPKAIAAIEDSQNRINSISLIHQKLYLKESITAIRIKDYIDDLVFSIINSLHIDSSRVTYKSEIDNLLLEVDTATPIGLILNELIINSLKHNPDKNPLNLYISLHKKENLLVLQVQDNGKGLPKDFDFKNTDSYGMKMIESVSKKLKASIQFYNNNGLQVDIIIKKYKEIDN